MIFKGSGVALITPFNNSGVDFSKLDELLEFHLKNKTDAIISCGTTGEAATMTEEEKIAVIDYTLKKVNGKIPVIVGAGNNNTSEAIRFSKIVASMGVDAILSVSPYYNKASQNGLYAHFEAIAKSVDTPIILYNVPSRTGVNINPETVFKLSKIPNIVAIKECNFSQVAKIKQLCGNDFGIYCGNDDQIVPMLSLGALGVISVLANILPQETHNMCYEFFNKNIEKSLQIQLDTLDLTDCLFCEVSPAPIKEALNLIGKNVGKCRLPLVDMESSNVSKLKEVMKNYGLL